MKAIHCFLPLPASPMPVSTMAAVHLLLGLFLIWCSPVRAAAAGTVVLEKLAQAPVLDGSGADWPKGEMCEISSPDGAAAFRLGYDAQRFYALVQVLDGSPLKNAAGRVEEIMKGGDAVGFCFGGPQGTAQRVLLAEHNGTRVAYVYRPSSTEKKPYTFASPTGAVEFDYVASLTGAQWAAVTGAGGYTLEAAIPWESLGLQPPAQFPFDLQVVFSDPAGTTNAGFVWWFSNGGPGRTTEDLPTEARLYPESWGVAELQNKRPRTAAKSPASAEEIRPPRPATTIELELPRAGRVSLVIEDESGWIVRELLRAEKREAGPQAIGWDGRDRYGDPLPPGRYRWKAAVFDGMGSRFLASVGSSGRPPYRTPDGLGAMGGQHGAEKAVAADAGGIYMAGAGQEGQPAMRKIDPVTGVAQWKRSVVGFGRVLAIAADEGAACLIERSPRKGADPELSLVRFDPVTGKDTGKNARIPLGLAGNERIGGLAMAGGCAWFTLPEKNELAGIDLVAGRKLPPVTLTSPEGLCRLDAGSLLVCSGASVFRISLKDGRMIPVIERLEVPRAVARDAAGQIYVSELGASQQIRQFSASGAPLAAWGRAGGKPVSQSPYDPLAFQNVTGMAIGPDGNLWLAEVFSPPRRFVKMTTNGQWLEDFYGPVAYNTFGPDLDDVSVVYYNVAGKQAGPSANPACFVQTRVDYTRYAANPLDPAAAWQITALHDLSRGADGTTINPLMGEVAGTGYGHMIAFTGTNGRKYFFRPSKHNRAAQPPGAGIWVWENNGWVPAVFISVDDRQNPSWADRNGDGLVQQDETFTGLPVKSIAWLRRDLTLDGFEGTLSPAAIDPRGVPDYRNGAFSPFLGTGEPDYQDGWTFVSPVVDGAVYFAANPGPERHLSFWDRAAENRLIKVADQRVQWVIGEHSEKADFAEFSTVSGIAGVADGILLAHNVEPATYLAFTTDGLTLGNVIVDATGGRPSVGPNAINIESFTGLFLKDPPTGRRMLFAVSSGDDRILEITGPGDMQRLEGTLNLPAVLPLQPMTAAVAVPYQNWRGAGTRTRAIDGRDAEWPARRTGIPLLARDSVVGDVRLRRDAGVLAVLGSVLHAGALAPGDGLELTLADRLGKNAQRFLITPGQDKKGNPGDVVQLNGVVVPEIKAKIVPRWHGLGYRFEADIPLELLPFAVRREQNVRVPAKDPRTGKMSHVADETRSVADLAGEFQLGAAFLRRAQGGFTCLARWPETGAALAIAP